MTRNRPSPIFAPSTLAVALATLLSACAPPDDPGTVWVSSSPAVAEGRSEASLQRDDRRIARRIAEEPTAAGGSGGPGDAPPSGLPADAPQPPVWPGALALANDAAAEAFCATGFREVHGDLTITGSTTDLLGLACLRAVRGDLIVEGVASLGAVDHLNALEEVAGSLILNNLPTARGISGFASLRSVGGDLLVTNMPRVEALSSFPTLELIGGDLRLDALRAEHGAKMAAALSKALGMVMASRCSAPHEVWTSRGL